MALAALPAPAANVWAYVTPGPEFFGQFLTLAALVFTAVSTVLLWPLYALLRFLRRDRLPPAPPSDSVS